MDAAVNVAASGATASADAGGWSEWPAPAKLNLFLHIVGRHGDGYHRLQTAFQLLDWGDTVRLRVRADGSLHRVEPLPGVAPEDDLAMRAAFALRAATGCALGAVTALLALFAPAAFTSDPLVRHAAVTALVCSALTQPLAALAFVYDGVILGLGDYTAMRRAMIVAIFAFAPLACLVLRFHWLGLTGVWAALGCWLAARTVLLRRRWTAAETGRRSAAPLPDQSAYTG